MSTTTQDRRPRLLSYSEIDTALTCWARWSYAYGGQLTGGTTLSPRSTAPILSEGRAWGAAVAAWHATGGTADGVLNAIDEINASFDADEQAMQEAGAYVDLEEGLAMRDRLIRMLDHYVSTTKPLPNLTKLEQEIVVNVPSRTGRRASNRFRFLCYLDGYTVDPDGNAWIVEFKLRRQLQPAALIAKARQPRWYAWAVSQSGEGVQPMGVILDERLNEVPKPARILKSGKASHAKDQVTTLELYNQACLETGEPVNRETQEAINARRWGQRTPLALRPSEVEAAGRELVSAAKLIRDLDSGELEPVRHATAMTCGGCRYRDICAEPGDEMFVSSLFERGLPKRDREPMELSPPARAIGHIQNSPEEGR